MLSNIVVEIWWDMLSVNWQLWSMVASASIVTLHYLDRQIAIGFLAALSNNKLKARSVIKIPLWVVIFASSLYLCMYVQFGAVNRGLQCFFFV
jgi:hypothetical protein